MTHIKDYDTYFEKYMARLYHRIIWKNKIKNINTVVEFAPGFKYKIAYALKRIKFNGTLYIIDINKNVLDFVYKKYSKILPNVKIILINKELLDSIKYLPKEIDLFLSNHPIDDVVISKYLDKEGIKIAFDNTIESKEFLINCWNNLSKKDNLIKNIDNNVYNEFSCFFKSIKFRFIIISQYKSGYYKEGSNYVEKLTKEIFDRLNKDITTNRDDLNKSFDFYFPDFDVSLLPGFSLKENIQNPSNWIAGVYKEVC